MVLPAILNPFVKGAPAAVMTRIALDWIIEGTPLDELFDEVAAGQYTRELTLTHFVQVMLDVASGFRPSLRAAFLRRDLQLTASISAFSTSNEYAVWRISAHCQNARHSLFGLVGSARQPF